MAHYAHRGRPPTTLTVAEQTKILDFTGRRSDGFRDHVLISLAMGTGLREHEIAALDVMDVVPCADERSATVGIRSRIRLRTFKGHRRAGFAAEQTVLVPDEARRKLRKLVDGMRSAAGVLELTVPLFASREGGRLSTRRIRSMWRTWQVRAGFERAHPFHVLRHTFVSNLYRGTKNPLLVQAMARHARVDTTVAYTHFSDEEMAKAARTLLC